MNVRPARQVARLGAIVLCMTIALGSLLTPVALADDPLVDAVEEVGNTLDETVDETVDDTTDAVGGSVDAVTEVVAGSTPGANDVTATAGGATDITSAAETATGSTPDVNAIGRTADAPNESDASTGTPSAPDDGTSGGGADRERGRDGTTAPKDRERHDAFGIHEWIWQGDDRLESTWANVPFESRISQVDTTDETDPCREDPSLVCLGLLYGMGRYAKFFSSVLGVLATTGIGVLGLMAIALALGTSGSAALVVARGDAPGELVSGRSRRTIERP